MSRLLLVRHAHAGDRAAWSGDDALRPLSTRGIAQAAALADLLAPLVGHPEVTVAASPAVRCTGTVGPLAARLGTEVRTEPALGEGADVDVLHRRLTDVAAPTVWCSHGDVIPGLLLVLADLGLDLGPDPTCRKASTWALELSAGRVTSARHLPPPDVSR